jgi:O-antigen/teichoic acid export membrane protein
MTSALPKARLLNHAAQGVMGWAVPLAITFVTTPMIVHGLGPEGFAVYAWAAAFAAGISAASPSRGVLHLVSRTDLARPRQDAIATGLWTAIALGTIAAGAVWALAATAASAAQLPVDLAVRALQIASLGAVPAAVVAVCIGALQGSKQFGTASTLAIISAIFMAAGSAWVATRGWGVAAVVAWQAITTAAVSVAIVLVLRRIAGPVWGLPTVGAASSVARFGLATIGTQLAFATWVIVERTLVGRYLGPQMLTALVVGLMLWMHANAAIASAAQVVASIAPTGANDVEDRLVRAYPSATVMTAIVAVAFAALIAGLGVPALTLWIGPETAALAAPLLLPLAVGVGINGLGSTAWFANEAEGRPARNMVWAATGLVITTVTLLWLAPGGDITSAGIARLVAVAPAPLFIAWTQAASGGRLRAPWLSILFYVVPSGILLGAGFRMVATSAATSWPALAAVAAIGTALYAAVVWRLPVMTELDRLALRSFLRRA